jgi:hypothetical protein
MKIRKIIAGIIGRILIYVFILMLMVAFIGGIYGTIHAIQTKDKGVEVEATICSVTKNTSRGKYGKETTYSAYVKYSYEGKEYNCEHSEQYNSLRQ